MDKPQYTNYRDTIRSGDLLIWSKGTNSFVGNILLFIIRLFTMSEYTHVGIAWKIGNRLFVIEANMPSVRIIPLSSFSKFYHIPMGIEWTNDIESYLLDKIGEPYSIKGAITGYFGSINNTDGNWQCAELANMFYKSIGIDYGDAYTPSKLVKAILENGTTHMTYVNMK